jgi:hypothetical protein
MAARQAKKRPNLHRANRHQRDDGCSFYEASLGFRTDEHLQSTRRCHGKSSDSAFVLHPAENIRRTTGRNKTTYQCCKYLNQACSLELAESSTYKKSFQPS